MMPSWLGTTARHHGGTAHTARVERTDPKANTLEEDARQHVYSGEARRDRTAGYRKPRTMRRSELEVGMACLLCRSCTSFMLRACLLGASRDQQLFSPPGGSPRVESRRAPALEHACGTPQGISPAHLTLHCTHRHGQVAERIGKGAYGGVWKAKLLADESDVVVKVVFPDPDLDPEEAAKARPSRERLESFQREIDVMSRLGTRRAFVSASGALVPAHLVAAVGSASHALAELTCSKFLQGSTRT